MTGSLALVGRIGLFAARIVLGTLTGRVPLRALVAHLHAVLVRCLAPVLAVVFPFGMVMALQGLHIFQLYGAQRLLSPFVAAAIIRELSPVMASTLVAAQGGSSFAAELGAMRIKEELDATDVMAVDSVAFHAAPRAIALAVACPILNVFGCVSGILGGYVSAVWLLGEPAGIWWSALWDMTTPADLWASVLKTSVFGAIIGLLSCFLGYHARGGAAGVGRAVNDTVVWSVVSFIAANYLLTSAFLAGGAS